MNLFNQKSEYSQWEIEKGLHRAELYKSALKKSAEEVALSDSVDNWQPEIASVAHQQAPFLSDYSVNVLLDKVDADNNAAYGNIEVKNKFDAPNVNKDDRSVKIPIVVHDKHLKPFDIMSSNGKFSPLSESKLKELLFRVDNVELSDRYPSRDRYIGHMSAPPYGGFGTGFSYASDAGIGKYASILDKIAISEEDKEFIYEKLANDVSLEKAFLNNQAFAKAIDKVASYVDTSEDEITCIRFEKLSPKEVLVKWANSENFIPQEKIMSTFEAAKFASLGDTSADEIFAMEPNSSLTLSTNSVQKNTLDQEIAKEITWFCEARVQDIEDNDLLGWVLPVVTFDNIAFPSYLFTNGSCWAFQDKIAGSPVGQGVNLPKNKPSGTGVFYFTDSGKATCTIPVDISHMEGNVIVAQDHLGTQLTLELLDIPTLIKLEEGHYGIPTTANFMRLPENFISLKMEGATFSKTASTRYTELRKHADVYSLRGYGTQYVNTENLPKESVSFMLDVMGFDGDTLVKRAEKEIVRIPEGNQLKIAHKQRPASLRVDTVKLASVFSDEDTVDKLLSLSVLNTDNVNKYKDYLPSFEDVESKLADLLFAVRCGLSSVPEENAKSAMNHVSKLIKGLKSLKEKDSLSIK
jgi:hypothetical protein